MIRPARVSSARNSIAAAAMSAGDSTGGSAASSAAVSRARDRREAGVSTSPGQMQLTRTPMVSRSGARQVVNLTTPALAAAYSGAWWLVVPSPAVEPMLMIAPPPRARIGARTSCVASMTARRFRSRVCSHFAGSAAGKHGSSMPPALLTRTPTGPAALTAARISARLARSVRRNEPPIRSAMTGPDLPSRSAMTTCMPSAASRSAIPAPIPSAPPVTRAVIPLSSMTVVSVPAPTFPSTGTPQHRHSAAPALRRAGTPAPATCHPGTRRAWVRMSWRTLPSA